MASPATRNAAEAPSSATLRVDAQATPAGLTRISRVHADHFASSIFGFLAYQRRKCSKSRIEQDAIEAALGRNVTARFLDCALGTPGHPTKIQGLKTDHVCGPHDLIGRFV